MKKILSAVENYRKLQSEVEAVRKELDQEVEREWKKQQEAGISIMLRDGRELGGWLRENFPDKYTQDHALVDTGEYRSEVYRLEAFANVTCETSLDLDVHECRFVNSFYVKEKSNDK